MDKREEIMETAIHLFSEKGYASTSVQEIAHACKISKGTLYNFFSSKEELLIQVVQSNYKKMLRQAENLNLDDSLPPKERLVQKILLQFDGVREYRDYMSMLLRAMPPHDNPEIMLMMKRIQFTMMNWYKNCLLDVYGSKAEPYIWDLALMLQGILKEYTTLILRDQKDMEFEDVARFIVERFDAIVENSENAKPVLTVTDMEEYASFQREITSKPAGKQLEELSGELKKHIENTTHETEQTNYIKAVDAMLDEVSKDAPQVFLIESLLLYLKGIDRSRALMEQIEALLKMMKVL